MGNNASALRWPKRGPGPAQFPISMQETRIARRHISDNAQAIIAPDHHYRPELADIALLTYNKKWRGVRSECRKLQDVDAERLYKRLKRLERRGNKGPTQNTGYRTQFEAQQDYENELNGVYDEECGGTPRKQYQTRQQSKLKHESTAAAKKHKRSRYHSRSRIRMRERKGFMKIMGISWNS